MASHKTMNELGKVFILNGSGHLKTGFNKTSELSVVAYFVDEPSKFQTGKSSSFVTFSWMTFVFPLTSWPSPPIQMYSRMVMFGLSEGKPW